MSAWAAIDLRDGEAVQLVGGEPGTERVRLPDPAVVAERWLDAGFGNLHVVDLDAALGDGDNAAAIQRVAASVRGRARLQVGGGVRDDDAIVRTLALGADRVVVGTRAVEDPVWLEAAAARHPDRLVVAADVRDGMVMSRGWTETTTLTAAELLAGLDALPLAGVLVTDVGREGREAGVDAELFRRLVAASRHPVLAAGGVGGPEDLVALQAAGAAGAVLGMAIYTGRLSPADALAMEDGWSR